MKLNTKNPIYIVIYGAITSLIFTAAIMSLDAASRPTVRQNELVARQRAIVELFDLGNTDEMTSDQIISVYEKQVAPVEQNDGVLTDPNSGQSYPTLKAVDDGGTLIGYAFPVSGTGFWARITGYAALTPDLDEIVGVTFLQHQETPGLGGRLTEAAFRDAFEGMPATVPDDGGPILTVGGGRDPQRNVDAITGATGTSRAVERFLNQDIRQFRRAAKAAGLPGGTP